jgi:hypothetical protein
VCIKEESSDVQGSWSRSYRSRNQGRFQRIRKRSGQHNQDCALVDGKSSVLYALKFFGISPLSVSKVEVLKGSMNGKHLVITCTLTMNNQEISSHALIDYEATGIAFKD